VMLIPRKRSSIIPKHLVDFLTYCTTTIHIRITKLYIEWIEIIHWMVLHLPTILRLVCMWKRQQPNMKTSWHLIRESTTKRREKGYQRQRKGGRDPTKNHTKKIPPTLEGRGCLVHDPLPKGYFTLNYQFPPKGI
jgi:hypothetical protein